MNLPALMGILNLTPDSFSQDGYSDPPAAIARFTQLVEAGADIIDIGAESTRPGATALDHRAEWQRLGPVLEALEHHPLRRKIRLSIDTRHAATAQLALLRGADIINDVSGLRDDAMRQLLAKASCDIVVMHALTVPPDPAITLPAGTDLFAELLRWKESMHILADQVGIVADRLIFDPGIGFGKSKEQSLQMIEHMENLVRSGGRWLVGHSRKSFLSLLGSADRDALTRLLSARLAEQGTHILRVHDVSGHRTMLRQLCM